MQLQLTVDCRDPSPLVRFWALALEYEPVPPPTGAATWRDWYLSVGVPEAELGDGDCLDRLQDPEGHGPSLWFQPVPEPKTLKNRLHLDLRVGGGRGVPLAVRREVVLAKVAQVLAAGAVQLRVLDGAEGHFAVTLQDPEGNEFCVT